jgi:hypothetical protein
MMKIKLNKARSFIENVPIRLAILIPLIFSLLTFFGWGLINYYIFDNNISARINGIIYGISFIIAGFSGIIQIIRKESPGFMGIILQGKWAIYFGAAWTIFCVLGGFLTIFFALTNTP